MHHESPPGSTGDEIYRIIEPEEIPELAAMMSTPVDRGASSKYAARFIELALRLVPEKHHFQLQDSTIGAVMAARSAFAADAGKELRSLVERVKIDTFMSGQTIIDNLLFGHVDDDDPATQEHARVTAIELLDQHGLKESIIGLIGDIPTGSGGGLIPAPGRERLALIRALTKKPDLLVLNQPLRSFPDSARARVRRNIRRLLPEATIVWLEREATAVEDFEKIYQLSDGRAVVIKANEASPAPVVDRSSWSSDASLDELFAGVHPGKLRQLSFDIDRRRYRSGDVVFEQGKPSAGIYVLAQGEIEIQRDASTTLARAGRGETLGLFATLSGTPHAVSGVATSDATVVFIDRDALLNWSRSDAEVATALLQYSAHRALRIMRSNQDLAS
jgi:ABC-type iron transport system FetAB ATPase subunit